MGYLTRQERGVLVFLGVVVLAGGSLQYVYKRFPRVDRLVNFMDSERIYWTVDLNTATAADLEAVSGIGAVTAGRIIDYRKKAGRFEKREQLLEVKGIGPATFKRVAPYLRVK